MGNSNLSINITAVENGFVITRYDEREPKTYVFSDWRSVMGFLDTLNIMNTPAIAAA